MNSYFARLTKGMEVDDQTAKQVWNQKQIAIHFQDIASCNPDDYSGAGRSAMKILNEIAEHGGYVWSQNYTTPDIMVGIVRPGSEIKIVKGRWTTEPSKEYAAHAGRESILKTLKLEAVATKTPDLVTHLSLACPRHKTISRWPSVGSRLKDLIEGKSTTPKCVDDLAPFELETLCAEFLRSSLGQSLQLPKLEGMLSRPGGTMKDIDLYGFASDGKKIYGQVTFYDFDKDSEIADLKEKSLCHYGSGGGHLLLFCRNDKGRKPSDPRVKLIPIDKVFKEFTTSELGQRWKEHLRT
jgi:hypothetical protein